MFVIRVMTMADYPAVIELMQATPGVSVRGADSRAGTERYLARNPGLSFVAEADGALCGCIMSGHDGRRGYLQHLLVLPSHRRKGMGAALVNACLDALQQQGILKCHLDVLKSNPAAADYWHHQGWQRRTDIDRYSFIRAEDPNA